MNSVIQGVNGRCRESQENSAQKFNGTDATVQTLYISAQARFIDLDKTVKKNPADGTKSTTKAGFLFEIMMMPRCSTDSVSLHLRRFLRFSVRPTATSKLAVTRNAWSTSAACCRERSAARASWSGSAGQGVFEASRREGPMKVGREDGALTASGTGGAALRERSST